MRNAFGWCREPAPANETGIHVLLLAFVLALPAGHAAAAVLKVPADHATIQAAVNAAGPGDVVWVAQGNYKENLVLKPRVRLEGGWNPSYSARNWNAWPSVVDGGGIGSVVVGADAATLDGFALRNGRATYGGGLFLERGTMTIVNNTIEDNVASSGGGGIYLGSVPKAPPYTDVDNNVIRRNKVTSDKGGTGGGIHVAGSEAGVRITHNTIGGKPGDGNTARWGGGGVYVESTPVFQIERNVISQNSVEKGHGGGVFIIDGSPNATLGENEIRFNSISGNLGAGIYSIGGTFVFRNHVAGNTVLNSPSWGGGIAVESPAGTPPRLENNFFHGNEAEKGAGIFLRSGRDIIVMNNSVAGNRPDAPNAGAGLYVAADATCILQNTILWGNGDDLHEEVSGACRLEHNDIEDGDGAGQNGNISANPLFAASDDLHVGAGSPVIDAGQAAAAPKIDIDGQARSAKVDIGADERITESGSQPCAFVRSAQASYLEPHIGAVRAFRDERLAASGEGRAIVRAYYAASPALSEWMDARPWAKAATRFAVTPVVYAIAYPLHASLAGGVSLLLVLLAVALLRGGKRE
jgi:hypothetical protein